METRVEAGAARTKEETTDKAEMAVKLQEYATDEQIEFFDRLRSGDDPEHEEARTELVELANQLLTILAFPIDTAAAAYVARTLLDDPGMKLWTGDRIDRPETEDGKLDESVLTDTEVRLHVVGDTGVMEFYRILKIIARLFILAGHGHRVIVPDEMTTDDDAESSVGAAPTTPTTWRIVAGGSSSPSSSWSHRSISRPYPTRRFLSSSKSSRAITGSGPGRMGPSTTVPRASTLATWTNNAVTSRRAQGAIGRSRNSLASSSNWLNDRCVMPWNKWSANSGADVAGTI